MNSLLSLGNSKSLGRQNNVFTDKGEQKSPRIEKHAPACFDLSFSVLSTQLRPHVRLKGVRSGPLN